MFTSHFVIHSPLIIYEPHPYVHTHAPLPTHTYDLGKYTNKTTAS